MRYSNSLSTFWFAIALLTLTAHDAKSQEPAEQNKTDRQPNIIMIMSDDQGWGDVGFNGNEDIQTPNLDAMAAGGVRLERFYAAAPLCSPTRGSCLTGRFPFRYGILAAHTGGMRVGEITIAEMLKDKGYRTGMFGKWHIGWVKPEEIGSRGFYSPPSHHGFDEYFATTSAVPTWDPGVTPAGWTKWGNTEGQPWKGGFPYVHNGVEAKENIAGDDSRVIMDRVIPFIDANKDTPFFAAVWFHTPHEPVVAGEEYKKLYSKFDDDRKQNYYGCITAMDEQIGRLRDRLRELKIEEQTLVFFCSDNGPSDGLAKAKIASAGKFKGHKHKMYEGGLLVPACVEWPGKIESGTTQARCSTVDFFPTIANLTGYSFSSSKDRPIDGIDLMPIISGSVSSRDKPMFFGFRRLHQGIDGKAIIDGDWKLLREAKSEGRTRLYNISDDPFEKQDLASAQPETVERLKSKLKKLDRSCQESRDGADYRY